MRKQRNEERRKVQNSKSKADQLRWMTTLAVTLLLLALVVGVGWRQPQAAQTNHVHHLVVSTSIPLWQFFMPHLIVALALGLGLQSFSEPANLLYRHMACEGFRGRAEAHLQHRRLGAAALCVLNEKSLCDRRFEKRVCRTFS